MNCFIFINLISYVNKQLQSLMRQPEKQVRFFFNNKRQVLLIFSLSVILLISCSNKIRISEYNKYNRVDYNWFQTFINDSLQFSIDFFGRNKFTSFGNNTKYVIPKSHIAILKNLGIRNKAKILLYLKPGIKRYGQASYGYMVDKRNLVIDTSLATFNKTRKADDFFILKHLFKKADQTSVVGGTEIKNKYFILIESQTESEEFEPYGRFQEGHTHWQLSSVLKGENAINYLARRKKVTNAIDSSLYLKNYISAINALRAIPIDTVEHYNADNYYHQDLVTRVSFLDNLDSIHESYEQYRSPSTTVNPNNKFAIDGDAINKVCEIAQQQKMMMINESHYDFRHRLFVYLLLDSLYKIGYKNLCIEDRSRQPSNNSFPTKKDGFYVAEPFMASVIRKAKEIGFNVYGYDTSAASIQEREYGQARNLYDLYSKDPNHKWVVLAGYAHINKRYFSRDSKSALQYFTSLAGFAPYSINQSTLSDITDQRYSIPNPHVGYYAVDTSSFVYKDRQADLFIINNITKHPFEAPFISIQPYLQKYIIEIPQSIHSDENILVYIKKELDELHDSAIPVYMSNSKKDKTNILHLPNNVYVGVVVNNIGHEVGRFSVIRQDQINQK